ncbi:hypothetical protein KA344_06170 [bacterium]|nr:hypothetical protein [bacterium]
MVDKLEATAKAADGAGLEKGDKGDNPSLNLVDITAGSATKTPDTTAGKAQADSAMKSLPAVDLVDSYPVNDSPNKAWNRNSFSEKDTPRYEGTSNWAKLEGPADKPESPKEQNRSSLGEKDTPRYEGTSNWAKLEGPTGQPDSPKEQNRKSFNVKEVPRYDGTGNW